MLPEPECRMGYTTSQLYSHLDEDEFDALMHWMRGQTMAICDRVRYTRELEMYEPSGCTHETDTVLYTHDVRRFLAREREIYD